MTRAFHHHSQINLLNVDRLRKQLSFYYAYAEDCYLFEKMHYYSRNITSAKYLLTLNLSKLSGANELRRQVRLDEASR